MPLPAAFFSGEPENSPAVRCLGIGRIRVVITRSRLGRRGSASMSCEDRPAPSRLPCRGRSNSEPPETSDLDIGSITYFSDGCNRNGTHRVSQYSQSDIRLGTVGGVTEWARIAMLTSAGRVQRCRAPVMDPGLLLARPELMRAPPLDGLRGKSTLSVRRRIRPGVMYPGAGDRRHACVADG